jgi:AAHS family 3-hydroxyphenylpropionic acid transporter
MAMIDPRGGKTSNDSRISIITVALCYLIALFEGFDLQSAGVAAPKLGPVFHLKPAQLGWFFSSSTFGLMLGAAIGGRLSDRFGRKRVLIASVAMFGLMSVATGLAANFEMLLAARFLTGLGIGGALPNLVALVSENSSPTRKNTSIGVLYAGLPSGGASRSGAAYGLGCAQQYSIRVIRRWSCRAHVVAVAQLFSCAADHVSSVELASDATGEPRHEQA